MKPRYSFKRTERAPGEFTVEDLPLTDITSSYQSYQVCTGVGKPHHNYKIQALADVTLILRHLLTLALLRLSRSSLT